jgi:hypothetical protein
MTTKKIFYSSVLALLLSACINETIQSPVSDSGNAVDFGTVLAPSTRGKVFTKDSLEKTTSGFSVSAYITDTTHWINYSVPDEPDLMKNVKVRYNSTTPWEYSPIKYWPGRVNNTNDVAVDAYGKVTFFALAGLESDDGNSDNDNVIEYTGSSNKPEFSYTTDTAAAKQKDLIADVLFDQTYGTNSGKVRFQFNHILSKIGFKAKLDDSYSGVTVTVTGLEVFYVAGKVTETGTYAFNPSGTVEGGWTSKTTFQNNGNGVSKSSGELLKDVAGVQLENGTSTTLNADSLFLMIIPQEIEAGGLTLRFTYKVTAGGATITYVLPYSLPKQKYELGKQYTYNFTLELNEIEFDTALTVESWADETTIGLDL